jgi:hypothetical protein
MVYITALSLARVSVYSVEYQDDQRLRPKNTGGGGGGGDGSKA